MTEERVEFSVLRQSWRENWLGSIEELANMTVQRSTWLDPRSTNSHYTFVDLVNPITIVFTIATRLASRKDC